MSPSFARTLALLASAFPALCAVAQTAAPQNAPQADTSVVSADGTAHITRVVPLPTILSPEARAALAKPGDDKTGLDADVTRRRAATQKWQDGAGKQSAAVYPVKVTESTMAGVPVRTVDPLPEALTGPVSGPGSGGDPFHYSALRGDPPHVDPIARELVHPDRVLIDLHGGGFDSDSGSLTESIPIANLTRTRVVSVLYRLAPEHPYPAAVEDAVAVYRELLKTYKPGKIAIYGTSAGAILTGEVAARLKQLGLPEPGALGIFSGFGDVTHSTDSTAMYTLHRPAQTAVRLVREADPALLPGCRAHRPDRLAQPRRPPRSAADAVRLEQPRPAPFLDDQHGAGLAARRRPYADGDLRRPRACLLERCEPA